MYQEVRARSKAPSYKVPSAEIGSMGTPEQSNRDCPVIAPRSHPRSYIDVFPSCEKIGISNPFEVSRHPRPTPGRYRAESDKPDIPIEISTYLPQKTKENTGRVEKNQLAPMSVKKVFGSA